MISLVIPTYQEAKNVPRIVCAVEQALADVPYEIIIVDDDSPDGTAVVAEEIAREKPNIKVIRRKGRRGVASAIAEGFEAARGEIIGTINADMQHPPELLPAMLEQLQSSDIVIASRYYKDGGMSGLSLWRRFVSRAAKTLAYLLLPRIWGITDPMAGYFLCKKEIIDKLPIIGESLSGLNTSIGVKYLLSILVMGNYNQAVEIPYTFIQRKKGKSKFKLKDAFIYLLCLVNLMWRSGEYKRVIKFYLVGGSGIGINIGILYLLTEKAGLLYAISAVFSWLAAVTSIFILNDLWTFRDLKKSGNARVLKRASAFIAVRLIGLLINIPLLVFLTEVLGFYYLISALITIIIVSIWNYLSSLNIVWGEKH